MTESSELLQLKMDSPIGKLYLVASKKGLCGIFWEEQNISYEGKDKKGHAQILKLANKELNHYFKGILKEFSMPLDLVGTPFQLKVWSRLQKIPYGSTKSYKDIATELKDKNACRAVGTANGKNPIAIIIPCHRVINANGALGGYAGGLDIKKKLLSIEGNQQYL